MSFVLYCSHHSLKTYNITIQYVLNLVMIVFKSEGKNQNNVWWWVYIGLLTLLIVKQWWCWLGAMVAHLLLKWPISAHWVILQWEWIDSYNFHSSKSLNFSKLIEMAHTNFEPALTVKEYCFPKSFLIPDPKSQFFKHIKCLKISIFSLASNPNGYFRIQRNVII